MNPVIVIPTYWASDPSQPGVYDHATAIDEPLPELARCLDSLDDVRGVIRTVILLVAPPTAETAARSRINAIVRDHPRLNPLVIGSAEARIITGRIETLYPGMLGETVSLRGYGAIRNMGLAVAAIFGHDVCVFMDDDEVALTPEFLVDAVYGLGQVTRQDLPLLAKTGHFIDEGDSHLADMSKARFWEHWWSKRAEFNEWMRGALAGTRICRSNYACGGCMAVHAEAYTRVAFDPWITRGEDLDYLFNLRLMGLEMWFDNAWYVRHLPPATPDEPNRFLQDVYRWLYERAKLTFASKREDLRQVTAKSLMPYPGRWISPEIEKRITRTALARVIFGPDRRANLDIFLHGRHEAQAYAERNASNYFRLMSFWSSALNGIWGDEALAAEVEQRSAATMGPARKRKAPAAPAAVAAAAPVEDASAVQAPGDTAPSAPVAAPVEDASAGDMPAVAPVQPEPGDTAPSAPVPAPAPAPGDTAPSAPLDPSASQEVDQ